MFAARRAVYNAGFFLELENNLETIMNRIMQRTNLNVLEVGCGEGSLITYFEKKMPWNKYIGLDISKSAIKMAAQLNKRAS